MSTRHTKYHSLDGNAYHTHAIRKGRVAGTPGSGTHRKIRAAARKRRKQGQKAARS